MKNIFPDYITYHNKFTASDRPHILMITNHGVHEWRVVPGLPDTGGQNVFVNQFSDALVNTGYRITIVNRGGYPHPVTGRLQSGLHYASQFQRLFYLEDGVNRFIRKEDMHEQIPALVKKLEEFVKQESRDIDMIISHYWDAAEIGVRLNQNLHRRVPHYWVPHSLGTLKKGHVSQDRWAKLRIDERIHTEQKLIPQLDGVVATSSTIQQTLKQDYDYRGPDLFLPPCVNTARYYPRQVSPDDPVWSFLSRRTGISPELILEHNIITEISRTDRTKRKDILLKAFARILDQHPASLLVVSIDERKAELASGLMKLINELGITSHVAVVGSIWELLPTLYAISDIYCTPSVMEGFGMSAQEAAATGVPVVSSDLVPFVLEYLLGDKPVEKRIDGKPPILIGEGAVVVHADEVDGFAQALISLLDDETLREQMGEKAYHTTIPYFTWEHRVAHFLERINTHRPAIKERQYG